MSDVRASAEDYRALYREAYRCFRTLALWSSRELTDPTPADAIAVAHALRIEGDLEARRLAERIEAACRAAH